MFTSTVQRGCFEEYGNMHVFSWRIFSAAFPFKSHIDRTRFWYPSLLLTNCLDYIFGKVIPAETSYKLALARELNKIIKGVMELETVTG